MHFVFFLYVCQKIMNIAWHMSKLRPVASKVAVFNRATMFLENLEMSGNLTAVNELSKSQEIVREKDVRENCLFITSRRVWGNTGVYSIVLP